MPPRSLVLSTAPCRPWWANMALLTSENSTKAEMALVFRTNLSCLQCPPSPEICQIGRQCSGIDPPHADQHVAGPANAHLPRIESRRHEANQSCHTGTVQGVLDIPVPWLHAEKSTQLCFADAISEVANKQSVTCGKWWRLGSGVRAAGAPPSLASKPTLHQSTTASSMAQHAAIGSLSQEHTTQIK